MNKKNSIKIAICLLLSSVTALSKNLAVLSQNPQIDVLLKTDSPKSSSSPSSSCLGQLKDDYFPMPSESNSNDSDSDQTSAEERKDPSKLKSKRIELYNYRNAENVVSILNALPLQDGCATVIPLNDLKPGIGVGQGGGNVIFLYGIDKYIKDAQRIVTAIDLPLPGIKLQLWGIQISSKKPDKLAETMVKVRAEIDATQAALRKTFYQLQGASKAALGQSEDKKDLRFIGIAEKLGYSDILSDYGSRTNLDIQFSAMAMKDPTLFYQTLYDNYLIRREDNGKVVEEIRPFVEAMKQKDRPPFHRFFRSRGLQEECTLRDEEKLCERWEWKERKEINHFNKRNNRDVSIVKIQTQYERSLFLDFALHFSDFIDDPQNYDANQLQKTSNDLNELLQRNSDLLQKDIDEFFIQPTLTKIQKIVSDTKGVSFAQVGRTTISTLNGVETEISTSSQSAFQLSQPREDFGELLARSEELQKSLSNIIPTAADVGVGSGPLPVSRLIGLFVALTEQRSTPVEIETGTSLKFTPGISQNLNSAELNIDLVVADPIITPTAEGKNIPPLSRVGHQKLETTVYTQALDFFDLSTFTNQATVDGGRFRIPVIGTVWNAIFGAIPGFGDLFSFKRSNQKVLHESLILTTSFITPTSLGIGNLYPHNTYHPNYEKNYCERRSSLNLYISEVSGLPFRFFECDRLE